MSEEERPLDLLLADLQVLQFLMVCLHFDLVPSLGGATKPRKPPGLPAIPYLYNHVVPLGRILLM